MDVQQRRTKLKFKILVYLYVTISRCTPAPANAAKWKLLSRCTRSSAVTSCIWSTTSSSFRLIAYLQTLRPKAVVLCPVVCVPVKSDYTMNTLVKFDFSKTENKLFAPDWNSKLTPSPCFSRISSIVHNRNQFFTRTLKWEWMCAYAFVVVLRDKLI